MTVSELFDVLDKRLIVNVYEAGNNDLRFDSSRLYNQNYMMKGWDYVKDKKVIQVGNDGTAETIDIFIETVNPNQ
ncbi:hypothetical protein [Clostridium sp. AF32-12BH]|uniref:hypothetical protein n=1 Tax=Clostridium sp. AF32-12BH TaxID=2292006 RepID=UPI000E51E4DC|nr:hypothetical protein [Clostridium sp. AF32-12BH]RHP46985.1 hypothetical protein DWZ40_08765 [Clostridium sp. AF32-12BH]